MTKSRILTKKIMLNYLETRGKSEEDFKSGKIKRIVVNDKMQKGYSYTLKAKYGKEFREDFKPKYTPAEMLKMGVFEGKYMNDCYKEFPKEWFINAIDKLSPEKANSEINYFKIKSRLSLQTWIKNGWIPITEGDNDVRGWFQWYCRYFMGRRQDHVDDVQIKRWKSFVRHAGAVKKACKGEISCRPKQRQALLQWAYDPFI